MLSSANRLCVRCRVLQAATKQPFSEANSSLRATATRIAPLNKVCFGGGTRAAAASFAAQCGVPSPLAHTCPTRAPTARQGARSSPYTTPRCPAVSSRGGSSRGLAMTAGVTAAMAQESAPVASAPKDDSAVSGRTLEVRASPVAPASPCALCTSFSCSQGLTCSDLCTHLDSMHALSSSSTSSGLMRPVLCAFSP